MPNRTSHVELRPRMKMQDARNLNSLVGLPVNVPSGSSLFVSGYAATFGEKFSVNAFDDFAGSGKTIPLMGPNGSVLAQATCTTDDKGLIVSAWLADDVADSVHEAVNSGPHALLLNYEMAGQVLESPVAQTSGTVFEPKVSVWKATPLSVSMVPLEANAQSAIAAKMFSGA
jgi:hypothetical protein